MRYVKYFEADNGKLVEACDGKGIVRLSGRWRVSRAIEEGFACNGKRRPWYPAFQIFEGESLSRARPITPMIETFAT